MAYLICQLDNGSYLDFELPTRPVMIGRTPQADLQIPNEKISRIHCAIRCEGGVYFIKDLGSSNGTWVNNERIQEAHLRFGDNIQVGNILLTFSATPRGQPTSKLPKIIEVELPSGSFHDALHQLTIEANQISRGTPPPRVSP